MNEEYDEWNKIKFIVSVEEGWYKISSVDFGAIPVTVISPISKGIKFAKLKTLEELNEYNSVLRWTKKTVGEKSILKKVILANKNIRYRFKPNTLEDLKFIDNGETVKTHKQGKDT